MQEEQGGWMSQLWGLKQACTLHITRASPTGNGISKDIFQGSSFDHCSEIKNKRSQLANLEEEGKDLDGDLVL